MKLVPLFFLLCPSVPPSFFLSFFLSFSHSFFGIIQVRERQWWISFHCHSVYSELQHYIKLVKFFDCTKYVSVVHVLTKYMNQRSIACLQNHRRP